MTQLLEKLHGNHRRDDVENKIISVCAAIVIAFLLAFSIIQTGRLERSMERCEQYRTEFELAQNRESEIGECISRTSVILSETSNTVEGLREKLEAVENSYNYMWELLHNDTSCVEDNKK